MKRLVDQKGYALLIVLFLIVFIMIISAVFIRGAIGNAKQENKVDENHLTVMATEAGVDYFKGYMSNFYFSFVPDLEEFIQQDIENQLKESKNQAKIINYELLRRNTAEKLKEIFDKKILNLTLSKDLKQYTFEVKTTAVTLNPESHSVVVSGVSIGEYDGEKKRIFFDQSFNIPDFSLASGGDKVEGVPNMHKLYPDKEPNDWCGSNKNLAGKICKGKNEGYDNIESSTVYFTNGYKAPNGNFNVKNSTIYSKPTFEAHVFNNLAGSNLNIDGSFKVNQNMNNIKNSTIKINGSMDINGNVQNMSNSTMIIRGSAHIKGHLTLTNSLVCVSGSSRVEGKLYIGKGSKLIHWDHFLVSGKIEGPGQMIGVNSENEVWEQCKIGDRNSINWMKPIIEDVNYE